MTDKIRWAPMLGVQASFGLLLAFAWTQLVDHSFLQSYIIDPRVYLGNDLMGILNSFQTPLKYGCLWIMGSSVATGLVWYIIGSLVKVDTPGQVHRHLFWWILFPVLGIVASFGSYFHWERFIALISLNGILIILSYHLIGVLLPYWLGTYLFSPVLVSSVVPLRRGGRLRPKSEN